MWNMASQKYSILPWSNIWCIHCEQKPPVPFLGLCSASAFFWPHHRFSKAMLLPSPECYNPSAAARTSRFGGMLGMDCCPFQMSNFWSFSFVTVSMTFTSMELPEFMVPWIHRWPWTRQRFPVPEAKQPHHVFMVPWTHRRPWTHQRLSVPKTKQPPPCFTVGKVLFSSICVLLPP